MAPKETLPVLRDGFDQKTLSEIDLDTAGITNVIWATGYAFDFSMIKLPVVDSDGFPIQTRGVSAFPGLFFVGLPWLHTAKSGLIFGVSEDARHIADRIAERHCAGEVRLADAVAQRARVPARAKPSPAARTSADRLMTLLWTSVLSLLLDGFVASALGAHPTPAHDPSHQSGSAVAGKD